MRTLVNKFDSKIRFTVPDDNVHCSYGDCVVEIPNGEGAKVKIFFSKDVWTLTDGNTDDGTIIDFLRTLKEVVDLRKDFKKSEIARGKDGCK